MTRTAFSLKITASNGTVTEYYTLDKSQVKSLKAHAAVTDTVKVTRVAR